jgi:hypothetical protein
MIRYPLGLRVLNAVSAFYATSNPLAAERIVLQSQTFNVIAEQLGIRNGVLTTFALPTAWLDHPFVDGLRSADEMICLLEMALGIDVATSGPGAYG